ncbi:MAG TPA: hypothetical protein VIL28_12650, partial [Steroidobacteraceae bacterium]
MRFNSTGAFARGFVLLVAIAITGVASARNDLPLAKPERVGMSSQRLALMPEKMQEVVDQGKVSGVVTLVARHGKV